MAGMKDKTIANVSTQLKIFFKMLPFFIFRSSF